MLPSNAPVKSATEAQMPYLNPSVSLEPLAKLLMLYAELKTLNGAPTSPSQSGGPEALGLGTAVGAGVAVAVLSMQYVSTPAIALIIPVIVNTPAVENMTGDTLRTNPFSAEQSCLKHVDGIFGKYKMSFSMLDKKFVLATAQARRCLPSV